MGFFRASRIAAIRSAERKFVWAPAGYIDELVQFIDSSGASDVACFACRHHNYNVTALLDSSGAVAERYDYDPYGKRYVLDVDYSADADGQSDLANPIGHQGLYHDHETGLIYNRARILDPVRGSCVPDDSGLRRMRHHAVDLAHRHPGRSTPAGCHQFRATKNPAE